MKDTVLFLAVLLLAVGCAFADTTVLQPPGLAAFDQFGLEMSVSPSFSTLVVGSQNVNVQGKARVGAAYIYALPSRTLIAQLYPLNVTADTRFASGVAALDDLVAVGAKGYSTEVEGKVFLYQKDFPTLNGWGLTETLHAPLNVSAQYTAFGSSVVMQDQLIFVGAPYTEFTDTSNGAVYVFEKKSSGWTLIKIIRADKLIYFGFFGQELAVSGDYLIIGSGNSWANGTFSGAAYVCEKDYPTANEWGIKQTLVPSDAGIGRRLGSSVAVTTKLSQPVAAISGRLPHAPWYGIVNIFVRDSTTNEWKETQILTMDAAVQTEDKFGEALAFSSVESTVGATVLTIGAPGFNSSSGWAGTYFFNSSTKTFSLNASNGTRYEYYVDYSYDQKYMGASVAMYADIPNHRAYALLGAPKANVSTGVVYQIEVAVSPSSSASSLSAFLNALF